LGVTERVVGAIIMAVITLIYTGKPVKEDQIK
jgi:hypothetical protein